MIAGTSQHQALSGFLEVTNPLPYSEIKLITGSITKYQQTVYTYLAWCCRALPCTMLVLGHCFSQKWGKYRGPVTPSPLLLATFNVFQNQCIGCSGHSSRFVIHILNVYISVLIYRFCNIHIPFIPIHVNAFFLRQAL